MSSSCSELSDSDSSDQYSFSSDPSPDELSGAEGEMEEEASAALPADSMDSVEGQRVKGKKAATPGVLYLSRVPPYMKPHKLKHLLLPYGRIGRVYLQAEGELSFRAC